MHLLSVARTSAGAQSEKAKEIEDEDDRVQESPKFTAKATGQLGSVEFARQFSLEEDVWDFVCFVNFAVNCIGTNSAVNVAVNGFDSAKTRVILKRIYGWLRPQPKGARILLDFGRTAGMFAGL